MDVEYEKLTDAAEKGRQAFAAYPGEIEQPADGDKPAVEDMEPNATRAIFFPLAVLLASSPGITDQELHARWWEVRHLDGWEHGDEYDPARMVDGPPPGDGGAAEQVHVPTDPRMVPWDKLTLEQQAKWRRFRVTVRAALGTAG